MSTSQEQFHVDVITVCMLMMALCQQLGVSPSRVLVADNPQADGAERLTDVLTRIKDHVSEESLKCDDASREATEALLAKVST
jgi:hypothetical protein